MTTLLRASALSGGYGGDEVVREVDLAVNPEIGRAEHTEYRWVSLDEARALVDRARDVVEPGEEVPGVVEGERHHGCPGEGAAQPAPRRDHPECT